MATNSDDKDGYNSNYQGKTGDEGNDTKGKVEKAAEATALAADHTLRRLVVLS